MLTVAEVEDWLRGSLVHIYRNNVSIFYQRKENGNHTEWVMSEGKGKPFDSVRYPFMMKQVMVDENGKEKTVYTSNSLSKVLTSRLENLIETYKSVEYTPHTGDYTPPKRVFNAFTSYRARILTKEERDTLVGDNEVEQKYELIRNHWFETMCNSNEEYYEYLMNWMAALVKRKEKLRTMIVMTGPQGNGKNAMWEKFLAHRVLGHHCTATWQSLQTFFQRFNVRRLNKRLHIFNEVTSALQRQNADAMKTVIDGHFVVERKHKAPFKAYDGAGSVIMSNNEVPVKIESGDRRYAVIKTSTKWAHNMPGQIDYMMQLHAAIEDERVQNLFLTMLTNRDISRWSEDRIPTTRAREQMQMASYEFRILEFFQNVVMYPAERFAREWYNPDVKPHGGLKAAWFSWDRVLMSYRQFKGPHGPDAERDLKRVTECVAPKQARVTAKLCVMRQKKPRDRFAHQDTQKIRCILIDKEEVRNLTRYMMGKPDWDYTELDATPVVDQSKPMCAFT